MNYEQLQLFDIPSQPLGKTIHDPYWDELEAQGGAIVDDALLSINAESEIFDIGVEIAHQQRCFVGEQFSFVTYPYKSVGEQVTLTTSKFAHQHDTKSYDQHTEDNPTHWIEKYWVERVGNKYWYYRYTWMEGRKMHRVYIGSVRSPKAQLKKQAVMEAIALELSPQEIKQLIRGWKHE